MSHFKNFSPFSGNQGTLEKMWSRLKNFIGVKTDDNNNNNNNNNLNNSELNEKKIFPGIGRRLSDGNENGICRENSFEKKMDVTDEYLVVDLREEENSAESSEIGIKEEKIISPIAEKEATSVIDLCEEGVAENSKKIQKEKPKKSENKNKRKSSVGTKNGENSSKKKPKTPENLHRHQISLKFFLEQKSEFGAKEDEKKNLKKLFIEKKTETNIVFEIDE